MVAATKIFKHYENNVDFLLGLRPPFEMKGTIVWLLSFKGKEFLRKKKAEFDYKPREAQKIFDLGVKEGEDRVIIQPNLRNFLNE